MLIERLKVSGLLSFGPTGIDLPLGNLNVLIGPNGSGKSNFLEVLSLLRAAPTGLADPIKSAGGIRNWLWLGRSATGRAHIDVRIPGPHVGVTYRHWLEFTQHGERFEVVGEGIGEVLYIDESDEPVGLQYWFGKDREGFFEDVRDVAGFLDEDGRNDALLMDPDGRIRRLPRRNLRPEESILSQIRDPERYLALAYVESSYSKIRLFRNWSFGPVAATRRAASTLDAGDFLSDGGDNLPLVLSQFSSELKFRVVEALQSLFDDIKGFQLPIVTGQVSLFLEEAGGRKIPAVRLSDGTLRYLCLLAILLHPDPPPLIAIEEPELGLHPDVIPQLAKLLVEASERTQLVITTHSRLLVDALSETPDSIVVCEKIDGESQFKRLNPERLKIWLEKYSLGELWSMGEIGGNRW